MEFFDEIRLGSGHSLLIGNAPRKITMDQFNEAMAKEVVQSIEKFGLFETSSPNYTSYYPDVTAADLAPEEGDFIEPIFRALSEVIVHKGFNPVDFSMNEVLKKSTPLLLGQTINVDHETALGNAMGAVSSVAWQDAYMAGNIKVPAGINAKLKIDGKSNPRIVRMIQMTPPGIHSTSVTVQFMWEKSHPDLSEQDFFGKLGTLDKEGQMIRRIASKVKSYKEISLVNHGADPFAMKVGPDGKIVNPKYAAISYNSEKERNDAYIAYRKKEKYFMFDLRADLISNTEEHTIPDESNDEEVITNTEKDMKQLALALGLSETATEAEILQALTALKTANAEIATLKVENTRLQGLVPDTAKMTELQSFKDNNIATRRTNVLALYNKTIKTPDANTVALINKADIDALEVLGGTYAAEVERLYPTKCKKCGSTEVSRASTLANDEEKEEPKLTMKERFQERERAKLLNIVDSSTVGVEPKKI